MNSWQIGLQAAQFFVYLVATAIGGWIVLDRQNAKLRDKIDETNQAIEEAKLELERRLNVQTDGAITRFGETIAAIRQKMTDMELWNRDNFVAKGTFQLVIMELKESWKRLEDKIDKQFTEINRKLDRRSPTD